MSEALETEALEHRPLGDGELMALWQQAKTLDPDAVGQFYFEVEPDARAGVRRVTSITSPADIEDVTADSMFKVINFGIYQNLYQPVGSLRGWVHTIGYRTALDFIKSALVQKVQPMIPNENPCAESLESTMANAQLLTESAEDTALRKLRREELDTYLTRLLHGANLTDKMRQSLVLRILEGRSNAESAMRSGVNVYAMKQQVYRTKQKLHEEAKKLGVENIPEGYTLPPKSEIVQEAS